MATEEQNKSITQVIYGLYAASLVVGVTSIAAIILNYVKRDEVAGTLYESHLRWQMRTFWFGLRIVADSTWTPTTERSTTLAGLPST